MYLIHILIKLLNHIIQMINYILTYSYLFVYNPIRLKKLYYFSTEHQFLINEQFNKVNHLIYYILCIIDNNYRKQNVYEKALQYQYELMKLYPQSIINIYFFIINVGLIQLTF